MTEDLYVTCFPVNTMSSRSLTCVSVTKTATGCDLTGTTTTTTRSLSSSSSLMPLMTGWQDYRYPAFGPDHDKIVSGVLSELRAENRLPMPLSSAGSVASASTRYSDFSLSQSRTDSSLSNAVPQSRHTNAPIISTFTVSPTSCVTSQ